MNYVVEKRKREFIHQIALDLRQQYCYTEPYLNILELLDKLVIKKKLQYHILSNEEWDNQYSDLEAFSQAHSKEIFLPEKLIMSIEDHDITRSRFTVAHEIGHIFLHSEETQNILFNTEEHLLVNSSEWQANYFAGALLAPDEYVLSCTTHQELIDLCRISWQASDVRFQQCQMDIPPIYNEKQAPD
ncbi:MAG: ImmA/IrrE family metallo-endopeptidase [Brevinema sp.]